MTRAPRRKPSARISPSKLAGVETLPAEEESAEKEKDEVDDEVELSNDQLSVDPVEGEKEDDFGENILSILGARPQRERAHRHHQPAGG